MRKTKINQADRIAKLEKVVSQLYITQIELIKRLTDEVKDLQTLKRKLNNNV